MANYEADESLLRDLAMRAVHENGFAGVSGNQLILEELETAIHGETVEKLMDGGPRAALRDMIHPL